MATATDVQKMDKKALRSMATEMGVAWDKRTDDEKTLRKKIKDKLDSAAKSATKEDGTFDTSKREPTEAFTGNGSDAVVIDPKTGQKRLALGCFGWLYEEGNVNCNKVCPDRAACQPLTEAWKSKVGEGALKELETLAEAEHDAENLTDADAEEIKKATVKAEAKASAKSAKATTSATPKKKATLTWKTTYGEETRLKVDFDEDVIEEVDDDDLRKFYVKLHKKHGGKTVTAGQVVDLFGNYFEVEDREETIHELVKTMVEQKELSIVSEEA